MAFKKEDVDRLLAQTGRKCCICKMLHAVQVHHIVPTYEGGTDEIDNAIPLCPNCHDQVHAGGAVGRVSRKYTASELKEHRRLTIEISFPSAPPLPVTAIQLLKSVADPASSISRSLVEGIELAVALGDADLETFCRDELTGYSRLGAATLRNLGDGEAPSHRLVDGFFFIEGTIDPQNLAMGGRWLLKNMRRDPERFIPIRLLYPEPVAEMELQTKDPRVDGIISLVLSGQAVHLDVPADRKFGCYLDGSVQLTVLRQIRTAYANRLLAMR